MDERYVIAGRTVLRARTVWVAAWATGAFLAAALPGCGSNVSGCIGTICKEPEREDRSSIDAPVPGCTIEFGLRGEPGPWEELAFALRYRPASLGDPDTAGGVRCRSLIEGATVTTEALSPRTRDDQRAPERSVSLELHHASGFEIPAPALSCIFPAVAGTENLAVEVESTGAVRLDGQPEWPGPSLERLVIACAMG